MAKYPQDIPQLKDDTTTNSGGAASEQQGAFSTSDGLTSSDLSKSVVFDTPQKSSAKDSLQKSEVPMPHQQFNNNNSNNMVVEASSSSSSSSSCTEQEAENDSQDDPVQHMAMHTTAMMNNDSSERSVSPDNATAVTASATISRTTSSMYSHQQQQQHPYKKPALTLSAFRRPAKSLTQSDPSKRLKDFYDLHARGCCGAVGHGAFSTVRLAVRRSDGMKVAVKSIAKHEALRSRRLRVGGRHLEEWEILKRMRHHPYVITLLDVFETEDEVQLVMEYCPGGELFDAIQARKRNRCMRKRGQYSETQAACITSQILRALQDLHSQGLVHRDVKPENILICSEQQQQQGEQQESSSSSCASCSSMIHVKLCDFGMARSLLTPDTNNQQAMGGDDGGGSSKSSIGDESPLTPPGRSRAYSMIGSNYYVAPEVSYGNAYDTAVDIYSLGVTLYILLCGFPPVFSDATEDEDDDDDDDDANEVVLFPHSYWKDISDEAKNLVRKMLNPDPTTRISAKEALRDDWIWKNQQSVFLPSSSVVPSAAGAGMSSVGRSRAAAVSQEQQEPLRSSHASATRLMLERPRPQQQQQVNLDLVRNRLYKSLGSAAAVAAAAAATSRDSVLTNKKEGNVRRGSKRSSLLGKRRASVINNKMSTLLVPATKRQRLERRASTALMALADLYRDVAQSTPSAKVIAATMGAVVVDDNNNGSNRSPGNASATSNPETPALKDAPSSSFTQSAPPLPALSV